MLKAFLVFHFLFSCINGFKQITPNPSLKNTNLKAYNNDYFQDLNLIHKFKNYFEKENYNLVINDLIEKKVSKIYINTDYKQLVTVDNAPNNDAFLYSNYHVSDINPIVLPNLVEKASDLHVPLYFVNFTPENIINIQNILSQIFTISGYIIPVFFILSIIF